MIVAALVAISLFGGSSLLDAAQTTTRHYHLDGWTVRVIWDRFTGAASCTVRKGRVELIDDVLLFHSTSRVDTSDAVFRIDGGPARSVREATYADQRRGYYRNGGPLENPSAGLVALPSYYAANASWVYIRADVRRAPDGFDVRGLPQALALARSQKCPGLGP
jgi:hypothetical protein